MTKPRSKRMTQKPDVLPAAERIPKEFRKNSESGVLLTSGPIFRHCTDCGCFKSKHHGGVCQRYPQPLTKAASDGCWDGVPLPSEDEQITEVSPDST